MFILLSVSSYLSYKSCNYLLPYFTFYSCTLSCESWSFCIWSCSPKVRSNSNLMFLLTIIISLHFFSNSASYRASSFSLFWSSLNYYYSLTLFYAVSFLVWSRISYRYLTIPSLGTASSVLLRLNVLSATLYSPTPCL